ncbi:MAG: hypothetical protein DWQ07_01330 [Chloroflexi bacterium]|nr:MAG: hypothetical protein DWQ07_01330 [Chloroflexota bacterium]MBL1193860.1 hypothetical protein [Chloroflexota bacterium]NOH11154.1 hypothetical protein [Chloroflexota bacterium]
MKKDLGIVKFLLLFAVLSLSGCQTEEPIQLPEVVAPNAYFYYEIDRDTLLQALDAGEEEPWTLLEEKPDLDAKYSPVEVRWSGSNYLKISEAMYRTVWQEAPDSRQLLDWRYEVACKHVGVGFDLAVTMFSLDKSAKESTTRSIVIQPQYNLIEVAEWTFVLGEGQTFLDNPQVDIEANFVSPEEALQGAEEVAGEEFRQEVNDACQVTVQYALEATSWRVIYEGGPEVLVDAITGEPVLQE